MFLVVCNYIVDKNCKTDLLFLGPEMDETRTDILILFPLIYMVPTYVLYIIELFTMFINRAGTKFAGSFFNIWVSSAINNLICSVLYYLTYRGTKAPALFNFYSLLPTSGFFTTLIIFIVYCSGAIQVILDLVLCFNRFTVILLGTRYIHFWKRYCKYFIFFAFFLPTLTSWEAWVFEVKLFPVNASDYSKGYSWVATNTAAIPWMSIPIIVASTVVITSSLSFVMNCYVCWYLIGQKRHKNGGKVFSNHDRKLFFYNLLIFFAQVIQLFLQVSLCYLNCRIKDRIWVL